MQRLLRPGSCLLHPPVHPSIILHHTPVRYMAGHNKWSKIKRAKGAADSARSKLFAKVAREVFSASRACGGDLSNLRLSTAIAKAKKVELPKDRTLSAVDRGANPGKGDDLEMEVVRYDGVVKAGSAVVPLLVVALTENRKRTGAAVRAAFRKVDGEMQKTGMLNYMFTEIGVVTIKAPPEAAEEWKDEVMEVAVEAGAEDVRFAGVDDDGEEVEEGEGGVVGRVAFVETTISDLPSLADATRHLAGGDDGHSFETRYKPSSLIEITDEGGRATLERFLEMMDDNEDVTDVFHAAS